MICTRTKETRPKSPPGPELLVSQLPSLCVYYMVEDVSFRMIDQSPLCLSHGKKSGRGWVLVDMSR